MKAYRDDQDNIRMFRPECNMERMNTSMTRLAMPGFNGDGLIEQQELRQVMEQCKFGGPKLKGLKVSRTEALPFAACSRVLTRRCRRSWRGCACRRRRRRGTWTCRSLAC